MPHAPIPAGMSHLLTPEGIADLKNKIGPVQLIQGSLPFKDNTRATDKVEQRPVDDRPVHHSGGEVGQSNSFVLFTLGVVYGSLRISFDLVDQFAHSEYGKDCTVHRLGIPRNVLPDVPWWNNVVEAINRESWDRLVLFLSECIFNRDANYWTICGDFCQVPLTNQPTLMPLAVFTPRSLATRLRPWVDIQGCIRLSEEHVQSCYTPQDNYIRKINLAIDERGNR